MINSKQIKINLATFDLVKGFLMIGIVIVHMLAPYNFDEFALKTPMNLFVSFAGATVNYTFFYISGYGFKPKPVKTTLKKTCSDLLKPYAYVAVFTIILLPVVHYLSFGWWPGAIGEGIKYFFSFLLGISESKYAKVVFGYELYNCAVVWFLLALFVSHNLLNLILKLKDEWKQHIVVVICVSVGYVLHCIDMTYFCLAKGLLATGYCYAGYLLKKHKFFGREKYPKGIFWIVTIATLLHTASIFTRRLAGEYGFELVDFFGSFFSGFFLMSCGVFMSQLEWKGLEWIRKIGMYTYWIMCIHSVEGVCLLWYRWATMMEGRQPLAFVIELLIRAAIIGTSCVVIKKISKFNYARRKVQNGKEKLC